MTEVWGAQVIVHMTNGNQFNILLAQNYPSQTAANSAASDKALSLKNTFTTALGNILGQLFVSLDCQDGQPLNWLRVAEVVSITPMVYQYS